MRPLLILVAMLVAVSLGGCANWDWGRIGHGTLKGFCRHQENCYATCPDGRRTDPNNPYCPGDKPQDQPTR